VENVVQKTENLVHQVFAFVGFDATVLPMASRPVHLLSTLWIGLVAGTLDITDNLIVNSFRGITPPMVFKFIASGLIGVNAARADGAASIALGVVIHFAIALTWTAIFYMAATKLSILIRRPVVSGLVYGVFVYLFMNFVVLPLTRVPHRPVTLASRINGVLAILLFIGLTISFLTRRALARTG
jgi:uncharacterized membrane protein YagU involved in acid resistance